MIVERARAKLNLVLHVGGRRPDGLHELSSLFAALELHDIVKAERAEVDAVVCSGVTGPNLAAAALSALRARARVPPLQITIEKHIPVAAGLGGGSADAAAVLRAANRIAGDPLDANALRSLAAGVGADVPSQIEPRHALVTGAGERVEQVDLPPMAFVLLPSPDGLATAEVYAEADRLAIPRSSLDPATLRALAARPPAELAASIENDLERAAMSLRPELEAKRATLLEAGALAARVTGSGPTVFGVFADRGLAERAAGGIPGALVTALAG